MEFHPDAIVVWQPPRTFAAQARVLWQWSRSDGAAGIRSFGYRWSLRFVAVSAIAVVAFILRDLRLAPLGLAPLLYLMWRQTRYKYRWAHGPSKYLWLPVAWAVGLAARSGGFVAGHLQRRRRSGGER